MIARVSALLGAFGIAALAAHGQIPEGAAAPPTALPIRQTFLTSPYGWTVMGTGAKVSVVPDPLKLNSADGALRLDYTVAPGQFGVFALPLGDGVLARAKAFRVLVRSDYATNVVIGMQEADGGRYLATFYVPKDKWQQVELTPADFLLADGPNDPKDPDDKLDLDQIRGIGLTDAAALWAQTNNTVLADLFGVKPGPHTLYLADFQINAVPLNGASGAPPAPTVIDAFAHPQIGWLVLGGAEASQVSGAPLPGKGLQIHYVQAPAKASGMLRSVRKGLFTAATKLSMSVASVKATTLLIQVEEVDGNKYNATVYVPAGASKTTAVSVSFADFKAADDSKDKTGKLDLSQVNKLLILDASGFKGDVQQETDNTLYIGDLMLTRASDH